MNRRCLKNRGKVIYVIRTSVDETRMSADDCVRYYKSLAPVERAFRSLKTIDLKVRPIPHRLADRVPVDATATSRADCAQRRAHIFLCVLAYLSNGISGRPGAP